MTIKYALVRMHILSDRVHKIKELINVAYAGNKFKNPEAAMLLGKLEALLEYEGLVAGEITLKD